MSDNINKENSGIITREGTIITILKNGLSIKIPSESLKEQLGSPTLSNAELEQMLRGYTDEQLRSLFADGVLRNTQVIIEEYEQANLGTEREEGSLIFAPTILGVIPPEILARQSGAQVSGYEFDEYFQRENPELAKKAAIAFLNARWNRDNLSIDESGITMTLTKGKDSSEEESDRE